MYSKDIEPVCGICVFSKAAKGVLDCCFCEKRKEHVSVRRAGCDSYRYDVFKRKVARKKSILFGDFSPEDFTL